MGCFFEEITILIKKIGQLQRQSNFSNLLVKHLRKGFGDGVFQWASDPAPPTGVYPAPCSGQGNARDWGLGGKSPSGIYGFDLYFGDNNLHFA